jgi:hypothetical protein
LRYQSTLIRTVDPGSNSGPSELPLVGLWCLYGFDVVTRPLHRYRSERVAACDDALAAGSPDTRSRRGTCDPVHPESPPFQNVAFLLNKPGSPPGREHHRADCIEAIDILLKLFGFADVACHVSTSRILCAAAEMSNECHELAPCLRLTCISSQRHSP